MVLSMKRILAISLALLASAALFFGAFFIRPDSGNSEGKYKLGMGTAVVSDASDVENSGAGASITTVAVIIDGEGKIVDCAVDCGQYMLKFSDVTEGGKGAAYQTKYELGDGYNMVTYGQAKAEWYKQADHFESYVKGKTVREITDSTAGGGDADLTAGCTIDISDFKTALVKAAEDPLAVEFDSDNAPSVSLAFINSDSVSEPADGAYPASMTTDIAAVATYDKKVLAAVCDSCETQISYVNEGAKAYVSFSGTKREKLYSYGMQMASGIHAEWYEQSESFCKYIEGMTASEIAAIPMGADGKATDTDLLAGCTVYVGNFVRIAEKAAKAAK